jgi:hypothetical protein
MKTVYIGGNRWSVVYKPSLKHKGKGVWGLSDSRGKMISMRTGLGQDSNQTLFHELVHAVCREYSANGTETAAVLGRLSDDDLAVDILAKEICGSLWQLGMVK